MAVGVHVAFTEQMLMEQSLWERRMLDVNSISKSDKSLLMIFEHLQPNFAFITEQVKPLPRMIWLNHISFLFSPQNLGIVGNPLFIIFV